MPVKSWAYPVTFRANLSAITDTLTVNYNPENYIGRPDAVHIYTGTDREIGLLMAGINN